MSFETKDYVHVDKRLKQVAGLPSTKLTQSGQTDPSPVAVGPLNYRL